MLWYSADRTSSQQLRDTTHPYTLGDYISAPNGHAYQCTIPGTSAVGLTPVFNTGVGSTTVDGGVTWTEAGNAWIIRDDEPTGGSSQYSDGKTLVDGGDGGVTWMAKDSAAIRFHVPTHANDIYVDSVPGDAFHVYGNSAQGTNCSGFRITNCQAQLNMGRALFVEGTDAQVGTISGLIGQNNWSGGIYDNSDIGNKYESCLMEANGTFFWVQFGGVGVAATYYPNATVVPSPSKRNDRFYVQQSPGVGTGGIREPVWPTRIGDTVRDGDITWICTGLTRRNQPYLTGRHGLNCSSFDNCYEEPDQQNSEAYGPATWHGSLGGFFSDDSTVWQLKNQFDTTGIGFKSRATVTNKILSYLGTMNQQDKNASHALQIQTSDGLHQYALTLTPDKKYWTWQFANGGAGAHALGTEDSPEGGQSVILYQPYLGAIAAEGATPGALGSPARVTIRFIAGGSIPGQNPSLFRAGDTIVNNNPLWGSPSSWKCLTTGRTALAWQPSHLYAKGEYIHPLGTVNGHVFQCDIAGTSGTTEPAYNTGTGATTADGAGPLVWKEAGTAATFCETALHIVEDLLTKDVSAGGTIVLSSWEAAHKRIRFTGVLPNNTIITVKTPFVKDIASGPTSLSGLPGNGQNIGALPNSFDKIFQNSTTGAFTLTIRTNVDAGIVLAQTMSQAMWSDGTTMFAVSAAI